MDFHPRIWALLELFSKWPKKAHFGIILILDIYSLLEKFNRSINQRVLALARMVYESDPKFFGMNPIFAWIAKRIYIKRSQIQGYGRHTREERNNWTMSIH